MEKGNVKALLPIGVFLVLYLGLGVLFEYGLGIPMGFYNIPIVVVFLVALLVACLQNRAAALRRQAGRHGARRRRQDHRHHDAHLHGGRRRSWARWAATAPRASPTSCSPSSPREFAVAVLFVVELLRVAGHGNVGGHHHAHHAHRRGGVGGVGLRPAAVRRPASWAARCSATTCRSSPTPPSPPASGQGCQMKDKFQRELLRSPCRRPLATLGADPGVCRWGIDISGTVDDKTTTSSSSSRTSSCLWAASSGINVFVVLLTGHRLRRSSSCWPTGATCEPPTLLASMGIGRGRHVRDHAWWPSS